MDNWERIFGPKCETCGMAVSRHTENGMVWTDQFKLIACAPLDKTEVEEP